MAMEKSVIIRLIKDFQEIYEYTIIEETMKNSSFMEYRFNVAQFLMIMHEELGVLPYNRNLY